MSTKARDGSRRRADSLGETLGRDVVERLQKIEDRLAQLGIQATAKETRDQEIVRTLNAIQSTLQLLLQKHAPIPLPHLEHHAHLLAPLTTHSQSVPSHFHANVDSGAVLSPSYSPALGPVPPGSTATPARSRLPSLASLSRPNLDHELTAERVAVADSDPLLGLYHTGSE